MSEYTQECQLLCSTVTLQVACRLRQSDVESTITLQLYNL